MSAPHTHYFALFALLALVPACPVAAQRLSPQTADGQIERSRLPNPALPLGPSALALGEPPESPNSQRPAAPATLGDSDLGVQSLLRTRETPQRWTLFADGGFNYTSNVALTDRNTHDDVFYVGEFGASYEWTLTPDLSLSAAFRYQYFAYNRFNQLDFGALNSAVALTYTAHQLAELVFSSQLGFTRLTHEGVYDNEFFRSGNLELSAQKLFSFYRVQILSVGADVDLGLSVPHVAEREEFGLSVGYIVQLSRHVSLQTGARAAYFLYPASGRADFNASGSTGLTYSPAPWVSFGATVAGTIDRSSRSVFNYDNFNAGGSVFFRLRF